MTTHCTHCGFDNPPGMRFCGGCGTRLHAVEPAAAPPPPPSTKAAPEARLSPERLGVMMGPDLMERLQRAGIEAAGQRRNVTILFTDLTGFTPLSEQLDGEDLYDIIQQYINRLVTDVYQYEGIVDKLTGDGLMALFGAPIAHENNAERAVRSALMMQADITALSQELKSQYGVELSMRVGLHAGPVVVGGVGSSLMMNYTAIGDTVNLAHRIEEVSPPGKILISEDVYRQVRPFFECEPVPILHLKGISRPVQAYQVHGIKTQIGQIRGIEGLRAPMVGREKQLNLIRQVFHTLTAEAKGQFIAITGEAGLGKSRLVAEFVTSLSRAPITIMEGQCQDYRRSVSYSIFIDLLYHYLDLPLTTPQAVVRERLVRITSQVLGEKARDALPYLEYLLSLPFSDNGAAERLRFLDAGQLRKQIFLAIRDFFLTEARNRPLLVILEDLHWADDASLELLFFLLESIRQEPVMVLAVSRQVDSGILKKIMDWGLASLHEQFHFIQLQNLSLDESERLLHQLLSIPSLPQQLSLPILQRADGIPYYLEEILRKLIDQGAIQRENGHWCLAPDIDPISLGVPDTLQGLILARFDHLESGQKRALQVASVIGKNFPLAVLEAVLQGIEPKDLKAILALLVDKEFIQLVSDSDETEYAFRHILMLEAIYSTLLRRDRSQLHGLVGQAIEALYWDRLESQIEIIANHFRWSPQVDRALHYLILAGQKAERNNINDRARQFFEAALELLPKVIHSSSQERAVQMGLGDALVFFGEYPAARLHYQEALLATGDLEPDARVEASSTLFRKLARTFERQGDYDQALDYLAQAQKALDHDPRAHPIEYAQVLNDIGWIHFRRGNFSETELLLENALELVENSDAYDAIASIYNRLGGVAYNQGDWERAAGYLRKSIAIRESIGDMVALSTSFNNLGLLEIEMGEFNNALENLTHSLELKSRLRESEGIAMALNNLGWLRIDRGELEEANKALSQALQLARQIGYSSLLRLILKNFGKLHLAAREWDKARQVLSETTQALTELGALDQLVDTYRLLGEAALGAGDLQEASQWCQKALDLVESLGNETEELSAVQRGELRLFRGMLAIKKGDWKSAGRFLAESEKIFQQLKSRLYQGRVANQIGVLAREQGDRRNALLRFREAALLFRSVGAKLDEKRAEEARRI